MKKYLLIGLITAVSIGITGCLLTGQITIVEDIYIEDSTDDNVRLFWLDLNENEDYRDNKDKIKSVDAISIVAWLYNNEASPASAEVWVDTDASYDYSDPDTVKAHATRVFVSPTIPPNDSLLVEWNDSFKYMENIPYLEHLIRDVGILAVYGLASDVPFNIRIVGQIVFTLTVGT